MNDLGKQFAIMFSFLFALGATDFLSISANSETITIRVVDSDSPLVPVPSMIFKKPPAEGEEVKETSDLGVAIVDIECGDLNRVQARPLSKAYEFSRWLSCRDSASVTMEVSSIAVATNLREKLVQAWQSGDLAAAVHIENELSWTIPREPGIIGGEDAATLAFVHLAKVLGARRSHAFDPLQGVQVMAPELQDKLTTYQQRFGISASGSLDYATVNSLSRRSSGELRHAPLERGDRN